MKELEINLSSNRQKEIENTIESACKAQELHLVSKNTLQKYPGSIHWHYRKKNVTGTLEITYWSSKNRCWIPLRDGRAKPWVVETAKQLKEEIEIKLLSLSGRGQGEGP